MLRAEQDKTGWDTSETHVDACKMAASFLACLYCVPRVSNATWHTLGALFFVCQRLVTEALPCLVLSSGTGSGCGWSVLHQKCMALVEDGRVLATETGSSGCKTPCNHKSPNPVRIECRQRPKNILCICLCLFRPKNGPIISRIIWDDLQICSDMQ